MIESYDIMVAGLGANGSSALYHLAGKGLTVIGIDRYSPPHNKGSSHGESRIIRQAYYEDPVYVPLLKAAYRHWEELEQASGKKLLLRTGGLMLGDKDAAVVKGSRLSADIHDLPYEYLEEDRLRERYPAFRPAPGTVGILEKEAGILFPEECIRTFLEGAAASGAAIRRNETILRISAGADDIEVATSKGLYRAGKLILTAGAWTGELLPELRLPLTAVRQVLHWFDGSATDHDRFLPGRMPVYIWEYMPGRMFYGFPDMGSGIKIAYHHGGYAIQPDEMEQTVAPEEIRDMENITRECLGLDARYNRSAVCMYTNTPDEHFIIDRHPLHKNIIIASPCSGHGYKFSSLTGKLLGDMALDARPEFDLSFFSIGRPAITGHL